MLLRLLQKLKAFRLIDCMDAGTSMWPLTTAVQSIGRSTTLHEAAGAALPLAAYGVFMNAFKPTDNREGGASVEQLYVTDVKLLALLNASAPMCFTVAGTLMAVSPLHPNALSSILRS